LVELGAVGSSAGGGRRSRSRLPATARLALLAFGLAVVPSFASVRLPVFTGALIYVLVFASLQLLVATSGQVSLCHVAFVAVGATTFAHLAGGVGLPWPVALVLAGLLTVPVGAFVAIPAIRLSGLYLALATLGFGILVERLVYPMAVMFGSDGLARAPRPQIGPIHANSDRAFYYVCLVVVVLGVGLVHVVNQSRLGRFLRAMSDSPLALTTLGAGVNVTRVLVFCISSFLAAVAGALFASFIGTTSGASFNSLLSLSLIVVLAISGRGEFSAPVFAAAALFVVPSYIDNATFNDYLPVLFGVSAMAVSVLPNIGISSTMAMKGFVERARLRAGINRVAIRTSGAGT
jgi:ABC-type branched-subunit amino acid transport system permease subunit